VSEEFGEHKAFDYMNFMNEKAPLTIRVNTLKVERNELQDLFEKKYQVNTIIYLF
jgi:16S rRNA C967 or C1407 C5-methylase (RsmB/RsmF family)